MGAVLTASKPKKKSKASERSSSKASLELTRQVAEDLNRALDQFKNKKKGLRILALRMGIHEKTLKRLMSLENQPGYLTLYKIYRAIVPAPNDSELLEKVPKIIREQILKNNPQKHGQGVIYNGELEQELISNRVMGEIYFLAACSAIRRDEISHRYGLFGLDVLNRMLSLGALKESSPHLYVLGPNQANYSPEGVKRLGINLIESFFDIERSNLQGQNYIGVFAEGLSEDGYREWHRILKEAFQKMIEVTKHPGALGSIRSFCFVATDIMKVEKEKS